MKTWKFAQPCVGLCSFVLLLLGATQVCSRVSGVPLATHPSWMTQTWTVNDNSYRQMEAQIDGRVARGQATAALIQEYKDQAQRQPDNPKAQFAWAYAAHKDATLHHGMALPDALSALVRVDPGNVYSYARLRFLLTRETTPNNNHADLEPMGLRLLAHDSQDETVHKNLVYDLDTRATVSKALTYAKAWVAQQPNSAGAHAVLASVYDSLFAYSHQTDYASARQVVSEYQKFLRLAPPNDPFRQHLVYVLQYYQGMLKNRR